MRHVLLLSVLAACGTPADEAGLTLEMPATEAVDQAAPPGAPLALTVGVLTAGATLNIQVSNADPGENVFIVRSTAGMGAGPCPGVLAGTCMDVVAPTVLPGAPFTANPSGNVNLAPTIPGGLPFGTEVCFQAVAPRGGLDVVKSPVVCRVSNFGPVNLEGGANTGDTFNDAVSMGGPGLSYAMKYTAPVDMVVGYVEVFTGELVGPNTVTIWSHDAGLNQPLAPEATGSWTSTGQNEWQGASLGERFIMPSGSTWWIVWEPVNGAQSTRDLSGTSVEYRGSFTGGAPWNGPFSNFEKFKLCAPGGCP